MAYQNDTSQRVYVDSSAGPDVPTTRKRCYPDPSPVSYNFKVVTYVLASKPRYFRDMSCRFFLFFIFPFFSACDRVSSRFIDTLTLSKTTSRAEEQLCEEFSSRVRNNVHDLEARSLARISFAAPFALLDRPVEINKNIAIV